MYRQIAKARRDGYISISSQILARLSEEDRWALNIEPGETSGWRVGLSSKKDDDSWLGDRVVDDPQLILEEYGDVRTWLLLIGAE